VRVLRPRDDPVQRSGQPGLVLQQVGVVGGEPTDQTEVLQPYLDQRGGSAPQGRPAGLCLVLRSDHGLCGLGQGLSEDRADQLFPVFEMSVQGGPVESGRRCHLLHRGVRADRQDGGCCRQDLVPGQARAPAHRALDRARAVVTVTLARRDRHAGHVMVTASKAARASATTSVHSDRCRIAKDALTTVCTTIPLSRTLWPVP
jgi:hypothetical protein